MGEASHPGQVGSGANGDELMSELPHAKKTRSEGGGSMQFLVLTSGAGASG